MDETILRNVMKLEFQAKVVDYGDALDGDIVQVCFYENPDDDPFTPRFKSFDMSINYEFLPTKLHFSWCNGPEFNGGLEAVRYSISPTRLYVELEGGASVDVKFKANDITYRRIEQLLLKSVRGRR